MWGKEQYKNKKKSLDRAGEINIASYVCEGKRKNLVFQWLACDDEKLRVDGGRDSNLVPEDEQQLKI